MIACFPAWGLILGEMVVYTSSFLPIIEAELFSMKVGDDQSLFYCPNVYLTEVHPCDGKERWQSVKSQHSSSEMAQR